MKILFFTEYFPASNTADIRGGVEARTYYIGKYLVKLGHEVSVITSNEPGLPKYSEVEDIRVIRVGKPRPFTQGGSFTARLSYVYKAINEASIGSIDIVDGQSFLGYLPAWFFAKKNKIMPIITYHDVWLKEWIKNVGLFNGLVGEVWERWVLSKKWGHIIANSNITKDKLQSTKKIPLKDISVIPNGVDECSLNIKVKKYNDPTLIYVGRLVSYKKVDVLIQATAIVKKKYPNIKVIIIGTGPEKYNLEVLVKKLDLEKSIIFRGFISKHSEVFKEIKKSHVFCFPSIVEGFGIVALEAMALGIPYVASNIPPIREATNSIGGTLVQPNSIKSFANALMKYLDKNEVKPDRDAQDWVKSHYWSILAKKTEALYKKLINVKE